jgi:NCAIR mutase (PurE)-related protein
MTGPFADLDLDRAARTGVPEVVYAEGKTDEELVAIARRIDEAQGRLLVTRLAEERAPLLLAAVPGALYHARARVLAKSAAPAVAGTVAILAAGTSDLAVAEEAAVGLEWMGVTTARHYDVGVAGLHRLLDRLPEIRRAAVLVVVAGMDGALPSVVAGLVSAPVIAVPTSVGYGASFEGLAALLTMLNACSGGVAVVNIDNGFGAALMARRILGTGTDL